MVYWIFVIAAGVAVGTLVLAYLDVIVIAVLAAVATGIVVPILVDTFAKTLVRLPLVFAAVGIAG